MSLAWLTCCLLLGAIVVVTAWKVGPRYALGVGVVLSMLVPSWLVWDAGSLPIDVHLVAALAGLAAYVCHPQTRLRSPLVAIDWALIGVGVVHLLSDTYNEGFHFTHLLRIYGEWAVPYLAGRLAVHSFDDAKKLAPVACAVCIVLVIWAGIEALTLSNPVNVLVGQRPEGLTRMVDLRMGLKRAEGPTVNPIHFGMLLLVLVPWTAYAARRAYRGKAWRFWLAAPAAVAVGIILTGSRSAMFALAASAYIVAGLRWRAARRWLFGAAAVAAVLVYWQQAAVIDALHAWSGDKGTKGVVMDGKEVEYSGTLHRLELPRLYRGAMKKAGWIGFGTEVATTIPLPIAVTGTEAAPMQVLQYIDNHYILMRLRFGYLGTAAFCLFFLSVVVSMSLAGMRLGGSDGLLCAWIGATTASLMLVLLTVSFANDFRFFWMWATGVAAGLQVFVYYGSTQTPPPAPKLPRGAIS
jgi:hypothetical protein